MHTRKCTWNCTHLEVHMEARQTTPKSELIVIHVRMHVQKISLLRVWFFFLRTHTHKHIHARTHAWHVKTHSSKNTRTHVHTRSPGCACCRRFNACPRLHAHWHRHRHTQKHSHPLNHLDAPIVVAAFFVLLLAFYLDLLVPLLCTRTCTFAVHVIWCTCTCLAHVIYMYAKLQKDWMLNASPLFHFDSHQTHAYICVYNRRILCKGPPRQPAALQLVNPVCQLPFHLQTWQNRHVKHANKATDQHAALDINSALYSHVSFNPHFSQRVIQNRHVNMQRDLLLNARRLGSPTICTTTSLVMSVLPK